MGVSGVVHTNPPVTYYLNNFLNGDPMYIGKTSGGDVWLIQKFSPASGVMLYANAVNNPTVNDYNDAWNDKVVLAYSQYQDVL